MITRLSSSVGKVLSSRKNGGCVIFMGCVFISCGESQIMVKKCYSWIFKVLLPFNSCLETACVSRSDICQDDWLDGVGAGVIVFDEIISMSRWGRGRGGSVAVPLDSALFRENSNCPTAARSAGTVGKWGITSFTSIRSAPYGKARSLTYCHL